MSLMPCFGPKQAFAEGIILGRLLAGYGEIEMQLCSCLVTVEVGVLDIPIRTMFTKRGAEIRIKKAKEALVADYTNAGLFAELVETLADMDWCRQIRNQYSHCQWAWTQAEGLWFANLEELAKQPTTILSITENKHPINVPLLCKQEDYFWYVKERLMYLETAYCAWDRSRVRGAAVVPTTYVYPKPPKKPRPPAHN